MGTIHCKKCYIKYKHHLYVNGNENSLNCYYHSKKGVIICKDCNKNKSNYNCYHKWEFRILGCFSL